MMLLKPALCALGQIGSASRKDFLVELHLWIVRGIISALVHIAAGQIHEGRRHLLCHESKVLRRARGNVRVFHRAGQIQLSHILHEVVGRGGIADQRRAAGGYLNIGGSAIDSGSRLRDLADALHQLRLCLLGIRAQRTR